MSGERTIIVTDTSPLITLALGGALDTLLLLGLPIVIPDAVYFEATRSPGAPGAMDIVEWFTANPNARIEVTETGVDQFRRVEDGRSTRGLGEIAAIELVNRILNRDATAGVLLIFEDSDLEKRRSPSEERSELLTTGDYLRELEAAGAIQSADAVLDAAAAKGRNVDKLRRMRAAERQAIFDR